MDLQCGSTVDTIIKGIIISQDCLESSGAYVARTS